MKGRAVFYLEPTRGILTLDDVSRRAESVAAADLFNYIFNSFPFVRLPLPAL